jgi:predicted acyltransferase
LTGGLIVKKIPLKEFRRVILIFAALGLFCLAGGFILRKWIIISKIQATPSWGMICNGISFLVFILLYWVLDVRNKIKWAAFLQPAGENSLTTYLAPDILYYLIWSSGIPFLIYKQSHEPIVVVAGSIVWALLMVGLTALLARLKIRLRI